MRRISRSSDGDFVECRRRGYYRYLYRGMGVDVRRPSVNLTIGIAVHEGMERLMKGAGVEDAVSALKARWRREMAPWVEVPAGAEPEPGIVWMLDECEALAEGLVRGWHRTKAEAFFEEFEVLTVEREMETLLAPNVILQSRLDVGVRSRYDGMAYAINWKTTGDSRISRESWSKKWINEVQTWAECLALENFLGEKVQGCIYEGMFKGRYDDGLRISVLNYGYSFDNPAGTTLYRPRYKASSKAEPWARFPAWKEDFPFGVGVAAWVSWLPEEEVAAQFVRSMPITKNDAVVEHWLRQVVRRESDIEHILASEGEEDKLIFFSQSWPRGDCTAWCPFGRVCMGENTIDELLEAGILSARRDHHAPAEEEAA